MADKDNKFQVWHETSIEPTWTAYTQHQDDKYAIYLDDLDGWDEETSFELTTEPKLLGHGSYVTGAHLGERILTVRLNTLFASENILREFRDSLKAQKLGLKTITMRRVFVEEGQYERKETLEGYITSISEWEQDDDLAFISFVVTCVDPVIVVS